MKKLVYGVGVNDADHVVQKWETVGYVDGKRKQRRVWFCPFHRMWTRMFQRCFCEKYKAKNPTYKDATCCEEWLVFSNFKRWVETQNWQEKQLDKDILVPENKVYSPETCAFVSHTTNTFVLTSDASRGEWPLGVCWHKQMEKFQANCRNPFTKKHEYLGLFKTPEEAHEAWRKCKHEFAQLVAELETDSRVKEALKKRYSYEVWYGKEA